MTTERHDQRPYDPLADGLRIGFGILIVHLGAVLVAALALLWWLQVASWFDWELPF